jgi:hypothetical protein
VPFFIVRALGVIVPLNSRCVVWHMVKFLLVVIATMLPHKHCTNNNEKLSSPQAGIFASYFNSVHWPSYWASCHSGIERGIEVLFFRSLGCTRKIVFHDKKFKHIWKQNSCPLWVHLIILLDKTDKNLRLEFYAFSLWFLLYFLKLPSQFFVLKRYFGYTFLG